MTCILTVTQEYSQKKTRTKQRQTTTQRNTHKHTNAHTRQVHLATTAEGILICCTGRFRRQGMCQSVPSNSSESMSKNSAEIPSLLKFWLRLGRATPKLKIGGLDFGFTIASCLGLAALKYATVHALVKFFGWPAQEMKTVQRAASCLVPIIHSGSLVPALGACFWSHKYSPSARFDGTCLT